MLDEVNFGVSLPDALKNLTKRVECEEIKYSPGSDMQREPGGNLAELIQTLANLIREKFKFEGKVRVLSARQAVGIIYPRFPSCGGWIWIRTPVPCPALCEPSDGCSCCWGHFMIIGILIMKRMVSIKSEQPGEATMNLKLKLDQAMLISFGIFSGAVPVQPGMTQFFRQRSARRELIGKSARRGCHRTCRRRRT